MRLVFLAILLTLVAEIAYAQDAPAPAANAANQEKLADKASDASKTQPVATSGNKTVYCTKGSAIGTRFVTETCYDETQMRDYIQAREQNQIDLDRSRAVCATASVCSFQ
jgi:hypothetical protein